MGSSAGAPPPDADPVEAALRRLVAAQVTLICVVTRPRGSKPQQAAEDELGAAYDAWWSAMERRWTGEM